MPKLLRKSPACDDFQDEVKVAELQEKVNQALPMKRSPGCSNLRDLNCVQSLLFHRNNLSNLHRNDAPVPVTLVEALGAVSCRIS